MAFEFTDDNFQASALESGVSVVDFWAEWCGPCKLVSPIIDEISKEFDGRATIGKMNVDSNQEIPLKYGVRSIPTILFIKNGEVVDKQVGSTTKAALVKKLEAQLQD